MYWRANVFPIRQSLSLRPGRFLGFYRSFHRLSSIDNRLLYLSRSPLTSPSTAWSRRALGASLPPAHRFLCISSNGTDKEAHSRENAHPERDVARRKKSDRGRALKKKQENDRPPLAADIAPESLRHLDQSYRPSKKHYVKQQSSRQDAEFESYKDRVGDARSQGDRRTQFQGKGYNTRRMASAKGKQTKYPRESDILEKNQKRRKKRPDDRLPEEIEEQRRLEEMTYRRQQKYVANLRKVRLENERRLAYMASEGITAKALAIREQKEGILPYMDVDEETPEYRAWLEERRSSKEHKAVVPEPAPSVNWRAVGLYHGNVFRRQILMPDDSKLLRVSVIGLPNTGKSTLCNNLIGYRLAAVSDRVQTTRQRTLGVRTEGSTQFVIMDTPGIVPVSFAHRAELSREISSGAASSALESDCILVVIDTTDRRKRMQLPGHVVKVLRANANTPAILVLNKVDHLRQKHILLECITKLTGGRVQDLSEHKPVDPKKSSEDTEKLAVESGKSFDSIQKIAMAPGESSDNNLKLSGDGLEGSAPLSEGSTSVETVEESCSVDNESSEILDQEDLQMLEQELIKYRETPEAVNGKSTCENEPELVQKEETLEEVDLGEEEDFSDGLSVTDAASILEQAKKRLLLRGPVPHKPEQPATKAAEEDEEDPIDDTIEVINPKARQKPEQTFWPNFHEVVIVSAATGDGMDRLKLHLHSLAHPAAWLYPREDTNDMSAMFRVEETIRDKLFKILFREVPYQVAQHNEVFMDGPDNTLFIRQALNVPKVAHKKMIVGVHGATIRAILSAAEDDLGKIFDTKVQLNLSVNITHRRRGEKKSRRAKAKKAKKRVFRKKMQRRRLAMSRYR